MTRLHGMDPCMSHLPPFRQHSDSLRHMHSSHQRRTVPERLTFLNLGFRLGASQTRAYTGWQQMRRSQHSNSENRRSQHGWARPPPRAASQTLTSQINPSSDAHTRIQQRTTVRRSEECESSSGGSGVQAQPCLRGLAEEAPPAEGAAAPPRRSQRTCVCA